MFDPPPYALLADAVLLLHFAVVIFVVGGPIVVLVGNRVDWAWVNRLGFRLAHLAAIAYVALQAWLGATCPLTHLENRLRSMASEQQAYSGSFVEYWIQRVLFYDAPPWVFVFAYTSFLLLVMLIWWIYPPARRKRERQAPLRGRSDRTMR
ncbi:DUF2784 domain-containing protein [Piscinibacter sakaiensis]|uniref:DUF2784 domain-containing protein n=1 Tax=Piscinibacter sakaiensis TaxID=1547922 RepID=UPI003AAA9889